MARDHQQTGLVEELTARPSLNIIREVPKMPDLHASKVLSNNIMNPKVFDVWRLIIEARLKDNSDHFVIEY